MMWARGVAWWMWLLMAAGTVGFWVVVVIAVRDVIEPRQADRGPTPDSLALLDERLARGEIDADEYLRVRRLITHGE